MIKIEKLEKKYSETVVVSDLNLEVKKGTIFGFLGPNGAGKTTTVKMVVGLSQPSKGKVTIDGKGLDTLSSREKIGYMPEDPYFYEQLNAHEFLEYMRSLFKDNKADIDEILKLVGLSNVKEKKVGAFSKGMKQRLGLAQALVNNPEYLFLDEPLDGLDPIGRLEFKKIFLKLKKEGKTIFFNSHVLSDVEEICDDIGIIHKGKLIYAGSVEKFCKGKNLEKRFVEEIEKLETGDQDE
ncbi:MAG: ABC transporter ATP-binding protein [Patescibacteria group bacterium]|jgi:ABC-2 type transport system ATP-binding protein